MAKANKSTGPKKRIKKGDITYTHEGCSNTKSAADKQVKKLREEGYTATKEKHGTKWCYYKGRKRKKSAVGSTRRRKRK